MKIMKTINGHRQRVSLGKFASHRFARTPQSAERRAYPALFAIENRGHAPGARLPLQLQPDSARLTPSLGQIQSA
jgi:hypothetical protein